MLQLSHLIGVKNVVKNEGRRWFDPTVLVLFVLLAHIAVFNIIIYLCNNVTSAARFIIPSLLNIICAPAQVIKVFFHRLIGKVFIVRVILYQTECRIKNTIYLRLK